MRIKSITKEEVTLSMSADEYEALKKVILKVAYTFDIHEEDKSFSKRTYSQLMEDQRENDLT